MCGIVGYIGDKCAADVLIPGLKKLEYRGYDSCGIALIKDGKILARKTHLRVEKLEILIKNTKEISGNVGIGHTRWATHGKPNDINAHPHISQNQKFAVVHNGIIENYMSLRSELTEKGIEFQSETDTEVIVHLLELYYNGSVKDAILKATSRLVGSYALGIISTYEPEKIYIAKEMSPLIIGVGAYENYFSSDITAIMEYARSFIYLNDGEFAEISTDRIEVFDIRAEPIKKKLQRISLDVKSSGKNGFEHFMLKEIYEQPNAAEATISPRIKNDVIFIPEISFDLEYVRKIKKIIIAACGSAYYAGISGKYAIEAIAKIPVSVELASEFRYSVPLIEGDTLVILLSQSGETADTIAALKEAKRLGAKTLAIVNTRESTIARLSDYQLYTNAGPEIAVATTKGYTTQLLAIYLFTLYIAKLRKSISDADYKQLIEELIEIPKKMQAALDMNTAIPMLAKKYANASSIFFIGRNTDYATALEGALKMKEISYIHAEAYAAGELKHGTIALIDENSPVIALSLNSKTIEKTMNNILEIKARGARVLAVTYKENKEIYKVCDDIIAVPNLNPLLSSAVEIIPLQLLSYYVAKERGCDIDKPKNLAKSVTVE